MGALRVNHVSIHADDLEESARFYEELFGMRGSPRRTSGSPCSGSPSATSSCTSSSVTTSRLPARTMSPSTSTTSRASIGRRSARGLLDGDTWADRARYHPAGWVQMYIRDPAGNLVEIDWPDVSTLDPEHRAPSSPGSTTTVPQEGEAREATLYTGGSA